MPKSPIIIFFSPVIKAANRMHIHVPAYEGLSTLDILNFLKGYP